MRPFLDQPNQFGPFWKFSVRFRTLTTFAVSALVGDFAMLQTRRSPSFVCVANMSDFWREEEACHARVTIGEGPLDVVKLCNMVNLGCSAAINSDPLENLYFVRAISSTGSEYVNIPNRVSSAVCCWRNSCDRNLINRSCRDMFRGCWLEQNYIALSISCTRVSTRPLRKEQSSSLPNATFPLRIHAATVKFS